MQNEQGLSQFEGSALSMGQLDAISAGRWTPGSASRPTTNINVNVDVDVIHVKGNNNIISGRDSWVINLFR